MTPFIRRTFLVAVAAAPLSHVTLVHAVDALPDARFVGFAETVNDFEIKSGQLALTKSSNELVRGYATRAVAEHTTAAQSLAKNRAEAGVSMAPDEDVRKIADEAMARLNSLQGADFDTAFATAQLRVQTAAVDQYGAYSQNGKSGPLRRYAQETLPKSQALLEYAKRLAGGR
jgi:putative membrane protein